MTIITERGNQELFREKGVKERFLNMATRKTCKKLSQSTSASSARYEREMSDEVLWSG